ncbi:hypothetical protein cypCar_00041681, partial [Cyprinus carpio]
PGCPRDRCAERWLDPLQNNIRSEERKDFGSVQFIKTDTSHVRIVTGRSAEALMPPPLRSSCARTTSMKRVVTHKLIHAFDHCRARVDWFNSFRHLACSEVKHCYNTLFTCN